MALFVLYLVAVAWGVLWKFEMPYLGSGVERAVKVVPFVRSGGYGAGDPIEQLANVVLFVPFGVYLGLLTPSWRWWRVLATAAATSALLEAAQFALAVGSSDTTDVVLNTTGAWAGIGLVGLARRRLGDRADAVLARACAFTTALALLATVLFAMSPLRYGPPGGESRPAALAGNACCHKRSE